MVKCSSRTETDFFMIKKPVQIKITSEYITLGQFLKLADIIQSGGEAKSYLTANTPIVNGQAENRRGRKLRTTDVVEIENKVFEII